MSRFVATVFGIGDFPWAPGTLASMVAIVVALVAYGVGGLGGYLAVLGTVLIAGFIVTHRTAGAFDQADPPEVVIDEVAGQLIALTPLPLGLWIRGSDETLLPWPGIVTAFLAFRLFDIVKPWPVSWADRMKSPSGIMLDDVLAGLLAAVCVAGLGYFVHQQLQ
ncbi:MAG: phosphatidylglycerophosphatase A [Paracoccaceae bacterium]|nr:phosphatidylglycerophosphatase A [Paracoccaceae bacterium]MDE2914965.1 phosphatidylglycerophosphatase A [Paracoccaceae bacterium]